MHYRSSLWFLVVTGIAAAGCSTATDASSDGSASSDVAAVQQPCKRPKHGDGPCDVDRGPNAALANAACAAGRLVGTAVRADALANDPTYASLLGEQFSYVTPENEMKWGSLQPSGPNTWDFTQADFIVDNAKSEGQAVKGHTLIWHNQLPSFVDDSLSAKELRKLIKRHIHETVKHYRRDVLAWDVVNEAIGDDGQLRDSVFSRKLGDSFIADAFKEASEADGDAKLYYNDYGIETINAKSDAVYSLVKGLKRHHVPIDGVGFQMHVDARFAPSVADLTANFKRFTDLGLDVNVSEMDVRVAGLTGTRSDKLAAQQQIYHRVVAACVATARCKAVTTWGFTDRYSWVDSTFGADDPLEFDDNFARKPAYYGMVDGFVGLAPDAPGVAPNLVANGSFESGTDGFSGFGIAGTELTTVAHTGKQAGIGKNRTDTWQGPAADVTAFVKAGWEYDASVFARIEGAASDTLRATLKVSCDGANDQFLTVASATGSSSAWTELAGRVTVPFCTVNSATLYVEGPAAGVDVLIDDMKLRPRGEPLGPNVIANPGFETDTSGWNGQGATLTTTTAQKHSGAQSALVTSRTQTWQGPLYNLLPVAQRGATYQLDAFVRVDSATSQPAQLTVKSTCDGATSFTAIANGTATNTDWLELTGSYQVPTCNLTELAVYAEGPAAGVNMYVDDVSVQQRLSVPVVQPPAQFNLLANGGVELGNDGWGGFGASFVRSTAKAHSGSFSAQGTGRTATWQGPAVNLPTGAGTYTVSAYALQESGANLDLILSASVTCNGVQSFPTVSAKTTQSGQWMQMSGTLQMPAGCTTAQLYVQQNGGSTFPDLYLDDVSVLAADVQNLIGNSGLELGTNGWQAFGATLSRSSNFAHSGSFSALSSGRSATWNGPSAFSPTGQGRYSVSLFALQNSGASVGLLLSASMTCGGVQSFPTIGSATTASGAWTSLSGNLDVPASCTNVQIYVQQNGGSTFPDVYADDLKVATVPQ